MEEKLQRINVQKVPNHIAVIMDGNGRWAKGKGMQRIFGHRNALTAIRETADAASDAGVKFITLYAFSTENWNRPKLEVDALMSLLVSTLKKELPEFQRKNVKINAIGNIVSLPKNAQKILAHVIDQTKNNTKITLTFALSYGSREEIVNTIKKISKKVVNNELDIENIDEKIINNHLYTFNLPDVDLMIRTSGEQRISNFLLWQIAYAELYFTDILWPDFRREHLFNAIIDYQNRERRFGKTSEQIEINE
ncbi:isoprenyl transferase [Tenacibaculum finnmarkense genomovar finnmarkense]|uniref:Isoprenyl transferase n=3 Tax=Tenacibaculum TaxID=104267 RepID=A0A2I2M9G2_9FLAO|nr:isoprenyl transferase [Tenacibaculum finnmarkense]ALU74123.1 UDP pyrophosphate synthase [Tenacibaculum dicentrarchi]MBE7634292.1 isoprenyl transferase [Tenacibaculum finnmarkense genomovar ulcerans]MBE7645947.1 isoprenyl transferase [Tenacibaculum finnmarkense genomovar ulcerans]MBE7653204.1 isoprenyl transferase [Tenacibaculum finnmarkense genomovar finnmarkense]MBE7660008.1 isoprenyl transferase [Tenacibaculum finnmarkense genomovar finnmarkense]